MCPPVSPYKGASIVKSSSMIRDVQIYFGMETPLCGRSGGHAGTAPTVSFGQITRGTVDVVWVDCVWTVGFVWVDCVCGFVCWENGAHEPTPSVLYFCQPRVD